MQNDCSVLNFNKTKQCGQLNEIHIQIKIKLSKNHYFTNNGQYIKYWVLSYNNFRTI